VRVLIEGFDLPGRKFGDPDGNPLDDVHVGVQVGREPHELVAGDAAGARWELDVSVVTGPHCGATSTWSTASSAPLAHP
jgi:hypothetical protein